MLGQELPYAEAGQHALVALQPGVARRQAARVERDVGVAEQRRIITESPDRERDIAVASVERRAVAADAVVHLVEAGIEAGAGRRAWCGPAIVAPEQDAVGGKRVGVRSLHHRMAGGGQAIAAPLVAGDEENVRASTGPGQSGSPHWMKARRSWSRNSGPLQAEENSSIGEQNALLRSLLQHSPFCVCVL